MSNASYAIIRKFFLQNFMVKCVKGLTEVYEYSDYVLICFVGLVN